MLLLLAALALQQSPTPLAPADLLKRAHTYSIVAYDSATGDLGVAVQSKFPNVGGIVPWAKSGVGAVATQSLGNTDYGENGLALMALGTSAPEALRIVMRGDPRPAQRQVGMVDAHGNAASWTGDSCFDWAGGRTGGPADGRMGGKGALVVGRDFAAQANIMVSDQTVKNMAEGFQRATGSLADRLMAALVAGQAGGGDRRGMESAALLVARKNGGYLGLNDRYIDIRNLTYTYDTHPVLRDVSLNIRHGETIGIVGRTGSGKSSLLEHVLTRHPFARVAVPVSLDQDRVAREPRLFAQHLVHALCRYGEASAR